MLTLVSLAGTDLDATCLLWSTGWSVDFVRLPIRYDSEDPIYDGVLGILLLSGAFNVFPGVISSIVGVFGFVVNTGPISSSPLTT